MKSRAFPALCAGILSILSFASNAALLPRLGGQAVYDTDLDVTWLTDANIYPNVIRPKLVQGYNPFIVEDYYPDNEYLPGYAVGPGHTLDYLGYQWRMPTALEPDPSCTNADGSRYILPDGFSIDTINPSNSYYYGGYNCSGGELGHLFYKEFGGTVSIDAQGDILTTFSNPDNLALFDNLVTSNTTTSADNLVGKHNGEYWTTTNNPLSGNSLFVFNFITGESRAVSDPYLGVLRRVIMLRDGDVSAVPVPAALWLFASGLAGLSGFARYTGNRSKA